jgi:hypothetical protein
MASVVQNNAPARPFSLPALKLEECWFLERNNPPEPPPGPPRRPDHRRDRRDDGDPDEMLSTVQVAQLLAVSSQWLEIGRHQGYGPKYIRLSPRRVR